MAGRFELRTVRSRLTLWFAGVLLAALALFSGTVYVAAVAAEAAEDEPEQEKARELDIVRTRLLWALLVSAPLAFVAAGLGARLLSRRALGVLSSVVRTANALSLERLQERIASDPRAGGEVDELVAALNAMLDRIELSASALRRFIADAAHELRTPLAVLMSELEICLRRPRSEAALRETLASALEGLARLSQLVEVLLTLARSDAGELPLLREVVPVVPLLKKLTEPYRAVAAERQLDFALEVGDLSSLKLDTDPLLLGRALANLLDNACKFCPPRSTIRLRAEHTVDELRVAVIDSGPGMSSDESERAGERFFRGAKHRGSTDGFGLGLAITKEFVAALGGSFELRSAPGRGTAATLRLPLSRAESVDADGQLARWRDLDGQL